MHIKKSICGEIYETEKIVNRRGQNMTTHFLDYKNRAKDLREAEKGAREEKEKAKKMGDKEAEKRWEKAEENARREAEKLEAL